MDPFLVRRRVETPGETSPGETSSESSTNQLITSGSCASTEGNSDEYCRRYSEAAASATFRACSTKRHKYQGRIQDFCKGGAQGDGVCKEQCARSAQ